MAVHIKIENRGPVPGVMKREHNAMSADAWEDAGEHWGDEFREKHFTEAGAAEYGYRDRTKGYEDRKQSKYGHRRPLVYTGESEQSSAAFRVYTTRYGAKITMNMPRVNWSKRGHEIAIVSQAEADVIAKVWGKGYDRKLAELQSERSTEQVS